MQKILKKYMSVLNMVFMLCVTKITISIFTDVCV